MKARTDYYYWLVAAGFVAFLFIPLGALLLTGKDEQATFFEEQRRLHQLPQRPRTWQDWTEFPGAFQAYYRDHFGFRRALVTIATNLRHRFGMTINQFQFSGREQWVFMANSGQAGSELVNQLRGADPLDSDSLRHFTAQLQVLQQALAARGIGLMLVIAPEKQGIYPEYLPARLRSLGPSRLDQLNEVLGDTSYYVDAKSVLLAAKSARESRPLYYEVNVHWNCWGAYLVYRSVVEKGNALQGWQVPVVSERRVGYRQVARIDNNILAPANWTRSPRARDSVYECLLQPDARLSMTVPLRGLDIPYINGERRLPEEAHPDEPLLYMTWRATNHTGDARMRALVLRDSFASYLVPYFNRSFSEVLYVHSGGVKPRTFANLVDSERPDVIILEFAERALTDPARQILRLLQPLMR